MDSPALKKLRTPEHYLYIPQHFFSSPRPGLDLIMNNYKSKPHTVQTAKYSTQKAAIPTYGFLTMLPEDFILL